MAQQSDPKLTASYKSPTSEPFAVTHALPAPPANPSVADKTQRLAALRAAARATQAEINQQLTRRMEEDKARDAASKPGPARGVDEDKEEENYGEEVQEEED
jgi:hypothetical protein